MRMSFRLFVDVDVCRAFYISAVDAYEIPELFKCLHSKNNCDSGFKIEY